MKQSREVLAGEDHGATCAKKVKPASDDKRKGYGVDTVNKRRGKNSGQEHFDQDYVRLTVVFES